MRLAKLAFAMTFTVVAMAIPSPSRAAVGAECDQRYPATCGERIVATGAASGWRHHTRHPRRLARHATRRALAIRAPVVDANGNVAAGLVVSRKTGARAHVAPRMQPAAQALVDVLEARGASIRFMGGWRRGRCAPRHMHSCGLAIDLCQYGRGRVDPRCRLPGRLAEAAIAREVGLFSGGQWCNGDRGHFQQGVTASACGSNRVYSARRHRHSRLTTRR
jgi:hypothetical protein